MDDEESRALIFRQQERERNADRIRLERALHGSPAYARELRESWEPIINREVPIPDVDDISTDEDE